MRPSPKARRARGVALLVVGLGALAAPSTSALADAPAGAVHELTIEPRRPLALSILAPGGAPSALSAGQLAELVTRRLATRTRLEVQRVDTDGAARCRGALACLVGQVPTARPERAAGGPSGGAEWLLILSVRGHGEGEDGVTALLVDLREARAIVAADPEETEARLFSRAVRASPAPYDVRGAGELESAVDELLFRDLAEPLSGTGDLRGLGVIEVELGAPCTLIFDGRTLGAAPPGLTRLSGVPEGPHHLRCDLPDRAGDDEALEVRAGEVSRGRGERPPPSSAIPVVRTAALWGGAATVALGATVVGVAAARSGPGWGVCAAADPAVLDRCSTQHFVRSSPGTAGPSERGLLLAPLGAGLALVGAGAVVGALIDEGDSPWIGLLAGVAAGLAVYGAAALLEPASASP